MPDSGFKNLERSTIVITLRQPFFDWQPAHDPDTVIDIAKI
ncbi:MAG: hypothetical protein QM768_11945 [Agriterribacter sp.]